MGLKQFGDEAIAPTAVRADTQRELPVSAEPDAPEAVSSGLSPLRTLPIGCLLCGERFKVLRRIGEGGMGVVYEAFDAQRKSRVALKTLSQSDGRGIYQFKNEFRALSHLHHPGLVRLHHLFVENDTWFFTMDLIDGQRFDRWARPGGVLDEPRLRSGLRQLVLALAAIHEAGKLHRDVKSSNVLVSADDRVIVLDLGLVIDCGKGGAGQTISEWILAGTPEYMAPEQAFGFPATPASDFYGMGVMLFEALTGRLPFRGQIGQILLAKQNEAELWPELLEANPAPDLAELCMALLSRDPGKRPSAADMLAQGSLIDPGPVTEPPSESAPRSSTAPLLGRADELAALWEAHRDASLGQPVVVVVSGESGIGKTELCRAFLDQVEGEQLGVVLGGRCYEREAVPFKAIDPLIDELSRYFRRLSREEAAVLLPRDAFALVKLFPVLGRVEVIAEAPAREVSDPYELQRRAFAAFAELIGRIRDRRPLILYIDDVHWTDADSATFLRHLLIDRALCPALFILSQRSERVPSNGALEQLLAAARANPALSVRALPVHPLPASDAETLAQELLERTHPLDAGLCRSIALEARGSPFFVNELARLARSPDHATERPSVSDVISARVAGMPAAARRLLEAAALVGQPLSMRVALEATGASHSDLDALLEAHLMRETETSGQELIECYHDRIRESVSAASSSAQAEDQYRALATALARDLDADPELVSRCYQGAGQRAEAARYAVLAAARASLAMAFDHAADLYRNALALGEPSGREAAELLTLLGHALENGGRGVEAAGVYRQAAALDDGDASLELLRRAADQLLATGHVDEGTLLLRSLCDTLDVHFPTNPGSLLLSLAWTNLRLRLRDRVTALPARSPSAREVLRLHTARTVVTGLSSYLPTHAASVAGQYLLMALDAGDVTDRVRSIGFNAYTQSQIDPSGPRSALLLERMSALASESGRAELVGFASMMKGTTDFHFDRYQDARRNFERALAHLRGCRGVMWEIDAANVYDQLSAIYCGDYADIARSAPALVDEALRRGRVWTGAMLSGFASMPAWLGDGAQGYRRQLAEVAQSWKPRSRPHWPDYVLLVGEALLGIFEGRPEDGFALLEARRAAFERYMLSRGPGIGGPVGYAVHQGRCAASALGAGRLGSGSAVRAGEGQRKAWVAHLRRAIRLVEKYGSPKARGITTHFEAVLSYEQGARERGLGLLRQSLAAFERAEMRMYAAASQRRLGELVGGDEGRELVARGEAFMQRQAVPDIEAETEMSCPGFARR